MVEKQVKHIMHKGVIGCKPDTVLAEVVRVLSDTDIHALVVINDDGHSVGVISHMDVIPMYGRDLANLAAQDIMTPSVISVAPEASVSEAIQVMLDNHIHRLVVTESKGDDLTPVGLVSTTDVVREMRGSKWTWYL